MCKIKTVDWRKSHTKVSSKVTLKWDLTISLVVVGVAVVSLSLNSRKKTGKLWVEGKCIERMHQNS